MRMRLHKGHVHCVILVGHGSVLLQFTFSPIFVAASKGQSTTVQTTESSVNCQSESVRHESNDRAKDQLRKSSPKTDSTISSNESASRTENVATESAESVEKVKDDDMGEALIGVSEGEGEVMEVEEQREDRAAGTETDNIQGAEVEDSGETLAKTSTQKDKVHLCTCTRYTYIYGE